VSMDLKKSGNFVYLVGTTQNELGGSHFALVENLSGGQSPKWNAVAAKETFTIMHRAIHAGVVRACHDLSEGGLAAAAAEMAFAGGLGLDLQLARVPRDKHGPAADQTPEVLLFSESNTRFLCEVEPQRVDAFESILDGIPHARIGEVTAANRFEVRMEQNLLVSSDIALLKDAWQKPLRW
jgi:phosphoribosylformylglycinamidine synthase subunit PurSL